MPNRLQRRSTTGLIAVYDGELAVGRQSNGLRGSYAPEAALQLLLSNSGLVAQFTTTGAFVLLPGQSPATDVNTPSMIGLAALARQNAVEQQYSGLVQSSINQALCGVPETRPGNYRVAMSFRIGLSGEITNLKLLGSTGDRGRDEAIVDTLQRLRSIDRWHSPSR